MTTERPQIDYSIDELINCRSQALSRYGECPATILIQKAIDILVEASKDADTQESLYALKEKSIKAEMKKLEEALPKRYHKMAKQVWEDYKYNGVDDQKCTEAVLAHYENGTLKYTRDHGLTVIERVTIQCL